METAVLAHLKAHGHDLPLSQARVFQRIAPDAPRQEVITAAIASGNASAGFAAVQEDMTWAALNRVSAKDHSEVA